MGAGRRVDEWSIGTSALQLPGRWCVHGPEMPRTMHQKETLPTMTRRLTWLLALAALIALAVAPVGVAGSKKGYKVSRGATTVTLDSAFAKTLADAGVTVKAGKPAKADAPLKFPITNGARSWPSPTARSPSSRPRSSTCAA